MWAFPRSVLICFSHAPFMNSSQPISDGRLPSCHASLSFQPISDDPAWLFGHYRHSVNCKLEECECGFIEMLGTNVANFKSLQSICHNPWENLLWKKWILVNKQNARVPVKFYWLLTNINCCLLLLFIHWNQLVQLLTYDFKSPRPVTEVFISLAKKGLVYVVHFWCLQTK